MKGTFRRKSSKSGVWHFTKQYVNYCIHKANTDGTNKWVIMPVTMTFWLHIMDTLICCHPAVSDIWLMIYMVCRLDPHGYCRRPGLPMTINRGSWARVMAARGCWAHGAQSKPTALPSHQVTITLSPIYFTNLIILGTVVREVGKQLAACFYIEMKWKWIRKSISISNFNCLPFENLTISKALIPRALKGFHFHVLVL